MKENHSTDKEPIYVGCFDNPTTFCRELWRDEKLIYHVSMTVMYLKRPPPIDWRANIGNWVEGQFYGDEKCLPENLRSRISVHLLPRYYT